MKNMRLLVVVPYRDREDHLDKFIPHTTNILDNQKNRDYKIIVVEQNEGKLFNRGLLCNIGFYIYSDNFEYVIFHDVDMLAHKVDYRYSSYPTSLVRYRSKHYYQLIHNHYFGGVNLFPKQDFIKINGFSNEYWGWGAEDDDLRIRCDILQIPIKYRSGKFLDLETETKKSKIKNNNNYQNNSNRLNSLIANKHIENIKHDGLSNVYKLYSLKKTTNYKLFTKIEVEV